MAVLEENIPIDSYVLYHPSIRPSALPSMEHSFMNVDLNFQIFGENVLKGVVYILGTTMCVFVFVQSVNSFNSFSTFEDNMC